MQPTWWRQRLQPFGLKRAASNRVKVDIFDAGRFKAFGSRALFAAFAAGFFLGAAFAFDATFAPSPGEVALAAGFLAAFDLPQLGFFITESAVVL